jgi:hypothetical protein
MGCVVEERPAAADGDGVGMERSKTILLLLSLVSSSALISSILILIS